jgi:hypothetical protein
VARLIGVAAAVHVSEVGMLKADDPNVCFRPIPAISAWLVQTQAIPLRRPSARAGPLQ